MGRDKAIKDESESPVQAANQVFETVSNNKSPPVFNISPQTSPTVENKLDSDFANLKIEVDFPNRLRSQSLLPESELPSHFKETNRIEALGLETPKTFDDNNDPSASKSFYRSKSLTDVLTYTGLWVETGGNVGFTRRRISPPTLSTPLLNSSAGDKAVNGGIKNAAEKLQTSQIPAVKPKFRKSPKPIASKHWFLLKLLN